MNSTIVPNNSSNICSNGSDICTSRTYPADSKFCWESLDDAKWFRDHLRNGKGHIYFVSPVDPRAIIHRGDTRWLDCLLESVPTIQKRGRAYWEGKPCPDPGGGRWELLIPCDLKVLDRIS